MNVKQHINEYDLLILGAGINGSMLYRIATDSSKKVLLLDKNDFASGSSQASGMMVWGGILYLQNFEFNLVRKLCKARDRLIKYSKHVYTRRFSYTFLKNSERSFFIMRAGLALYRILGLLKRGKTKCFANNKLPFNWSKTLFKGGLSYEEGFLKLSDSQFTLDWIFRQNATESKAYNYTNIQSIEWEEKENHFKILFINYEKVKTTVYAKSIVNTCGIWADNVNKQFNIQTKASHHLSKGVYLLLNNPKTQKDAFVVDMEENNDTLCWVPWGNTIMWGPTETSIISEKELPVTKEDVTFLLDKLNAKLKNKISKSDIINVRTGIRPLVKQNDNEVKYSLDLSRKAIFESNKKIPWHTVFGGKLSGGLEFSNEVYYKIFKESPNPINFNSTVQAPTTNEFYNGIELPDVDWTVKNTQVRCLDDYLRRRTNIAQWIPVGGLGFKNEYLHDIMKISELIHCSKSEAEFDFKKYTETQRKERTTWEN
ncbi:FAD-dependent oxidoreductase [Carboxylicivirga marina]|uniref:FAD-dependent oxidoreductase n=1 Tax=Carboxylicivirga marina TaxID=2800988 RepID=A0ABS1HEC4_9BACT|nr:FAD-dependent oxidoreductase [Carboxylicivirga marina]MBK3515973.1 FAD-dependent oxidoreductase [Carboxylicivirga marina]